MELRTKSFAPKLAFAEQANAARPGPGFADFVEFGRDPLVATSTAQTVASAGAGALGDDIACYARAAFARACAPARGLLAARSLPTSRGYKLGSWSTASRASSPAARKSRRLAAR